MEEETPEFFHSYDNFAVDDLLIDFSDHDHDDENDAAADLDEDVASTALANSFNSYSSGGDFRSFSDGTTFSGDLCVPYDDKAELEWLSNFVEESFSSEDNKNLQLISGFSKNTPPDPQSEFADPNPIGINPIFTTDVSVPAKARSKRSRVAACNWASRSILTDDPNPSNTEPFITPELPVVSPSSLQQVQKKPGGGSRRRDVGEVSGGGEERRCLHCATDKTPQWRTGPMGPKTLCNACGVRYKSGRLVPEYRPAASPTFVQAKHSNSHRKVMELRRQKEMMTSQQEFLLLHQYQKADVTFDASSEGEDYLIHQTVGPDFIQLI